MYEYNCEKCGCVFEKIQKFSDPLLTKHENCGGKLTKLISKSAFHLKGDGWYVTDYARPHKNEPVQDDPQEKKKEHGTESGKTNDSSSDKESSGDSSLPSDASGSKKESSSTKDNAKPTQ